MSLAMLNPKFAAAAEGTAGPALLGRSAPPLLDQEFRQFQQMLQRTAGIHLSSAKKALVAGRLARRVQAHGLSSYEDYLQLIQADATEHQAALDLLTTNETHFFREPRHFEVLANLMLPNCVASRPVRVWSAACSTGQEPYSIGMLLAQELGEAGWEVLGTDLSTRVLATAHAATYDKALMQEIPAPLLRRFCLRGIGSQAARFMVAPEITRAVRFAQLNLNETLPELGQFDIVFVRNVLIYFNEDTKRTVLQRIVRQLRPGGYLVVGHAESLANLGLGLEALMPSVQRKPI